MPAAVRLHFPQGSGLGRLYVTRAKAVALNVVSAVLGADISGQHLQAALCGSICGYGFPSQFGHHGTDIDDLAVPLFDHGRNHCLGYDKGSV